jgi:nitrate reductase assembly molybdenum cofactor insertion protein NarJ
MNAQYERIFGLMMSKKCPPYETEFCPQTFSVFRSQTLADVAGFYRAFGVEPSRDKPERDDHLSLELGFMAYLIAREENASETEQITICRNAQKRFAREHLVWWVPAFARALERQCQRMLDRTDGESTPYELLAAALAAFMPIERAILDIDSPKELVAPGPVEPLEEMSCSTCAGSCDSSGRLN